MQIQSPQKSSVTRLAVGAVGMALAGCAIGPEGSLRSSERLTTFGANPQFDNERYEMVDLLTLLDPEGKRFSLASKTISDADLFVSSSPTSGSAGDAQANTENHAKSRRELALAEHAFYTYADDPVPRRDRVQDRLIGASNQRCAAYKVYLNRFDAYQQTGFGWATTLFGGAAGIVGGLKDARILGGLAGISSGMQAEISQGFLGNLASYVIVPGIELRRKSILAEIMARRSGEYTLQAALADAARYHGACTLVVGLEQAKEAIQTVENPGMRMMAVTLNQVMQTRAMQQTLAKQEANKAEPEDYIIRSFRFEDVPIAAAVGLGGVRAVDGFGSNTPDSPAVVTAAVGKHAKTLLDGVKNQRGGLDATLQTLKEELDQPSKPELKDKLGILHKELTAARTTLEASIDALVKQASGNATQAHAAQACLGKLQDMAQYAKPEGVMLARADLASATALVNSLYGDWTRNAKSGLNDWMKKMDGALADTRFDRIKELKPSELNADARAKAVRDPSAQAASLLPALPAPDFAGKKIACP